MAPQRMEAAPANTQSDEDVAGYPMRVASGAPLPAIEQNNHLPLTRVLTVSNIGVKETVSEHQPQRHHLGVLSVLDIIDQPYDYLQ